MWKIIALFVAVTLVSLASPGTVLAQDKASDANKKQVEELGVIRARLTTKLADYHKSLSPQAVAARFNTLQTEYQAAKTSVLKKIEAENVKAVHDAAALAALIAKNQAIDEMMSRTFAKQWYIYSNFMNDQGQMNNYFNTLDSMSNYSDNWLRLGIDLQVLNKLVLSYEAQLDKTQAKVNEMVVTINKAMDAAEAVYKG